MNKLIFILCLISSVLSAQDKENTNIYTVADVMPQFPGGDDSLINFISRNLIYPSIAQEKDIQCNIKVTFTVKEDGSLKINKIKNSKHKVFKDEVYRLFNLMPKWTPGKQNGKIVRVYIELPLNFSLEE